MKTEKIINDSQFIEWLTEVKQLVRKSQIKAAVRVNAEMLKMYWEIGRKIVFQQAEAVGEPDFIRP